MWLDRLEAEHDNLRAALDWCREEESGAEAGLRLAKAMYRFWRVRGYLAEGRERLAAAVGHPGAREHPLERASALRFASGLEQVQGNLTAARALAEEALALFESTENARGGAGVLLTLGNVALIQGDLAGARAYYERGLPLYRQLGEQDGVARALGNLGAVMQARAIWREQRLSARRAWPSSGKRGTRRIQHERWAAWGRSPTRGARTAKRGHGWRKLLPYFTGSGHGTAASSAACACWGRWRCGRGARWRPGCGWRKG